MTPYYLLWILFSLWAVIRLLLDKREPSSTIAWLFFVVFVPIAGPAVFFVFGPQRLERRAIKRKKAIERRLSHASFQRPSTDPPMELAEQDSHVLALAKQISEYPATAGNVVEVLADPNQALLAMQAAIASAQRFIHLEYYIIANDEVTQALFDSLLEAAKRGVEVRILYDALGSLTLKRRYFKKLVDNKAKVAGFMPLTLFPQRVHFNFRNHRKILIADGRVAFTGGTNIGRQYLGLRNDQQWHDYTVKVEGPVCMQLQDVFGKDWHFTTQEDLFQSRYYHRPSRPGDAIIQVLESGPDAPFRTLHQALFMVINSAQREILMSTPYFVPDPAIMTSLTVAALRGVKVRLLVPSKSDAPLVQYASRSFFDTLLRAGVEIYEYQPRILHSKLLIIDGRWSILGSANMDIRSFRLNFEINVLIRGSSVGEQVSRLFHVDLGQSRRVNLDEFMRRPLISQFLENACRLLSPIL